MARRALSVPAAVRPASPNDRTVVMALVRESTADSPYADAPAYFLRRAFDVGDDEARVLVCEQRGAIVGCVVYGKVAGTVGTGRVHYVAVSAETRRCGVASALCEAAIGELTSAGARSVIVEMPDDGESRPGLALLARCGLSVVARVADYYRDGVHLIVLERRSVT